MPRSTAPTKLRPRWRRWTAIVAVAVGLGSLAWTALELGWVRTVWQDGGELRFAGDAFRPRNILWAPPRLVETAAVEEAAVDGAEPIAELPIGEPIVLALPSPQGDLDIYVREPRVGGWSEPTPLVARDPTGAGVNTTARELSPWLAPGGRVLYFASDREGSLGGLDLWVSRRGRDGWSAARNLGARVNSPYDDLEPALRSDLQVLVFATNRPAGFLFSPPEAWVDVSLERWPAREHNLAWTFREPTKAGGSRWATVGPVAELRSESDERDPSFSPGDRYLWFSSSRAGGLGGFDLYRARLERSPLAGDAESVDRTLRVAAAENIGAPVNTAGDERRPMLRDGGFAVVYRYRPEERRSSALVSSRSLEVDSELEVASLPLEAFVAHFGRLAGLIAAALALSLVSIVLFRTRQSWSGNLQARSAVAAVLLHALLLYGFYFWRVGNEILALARDDTARPVTLETTLALEISEEIRRIEPVVEPAAGPTASATPTSVEQLAVEAARPRPAEPSSDPLETPIESVGELVAIAMDAPRRAPDDPSLTRPEPLESVVDRTTTPAPRAEPLPQPEAAPAEAPESLAPSERAPSTAPEEVDPTRDLAVRAVALTADSPGDPGAASTVRLAATPVQAPNDASLLPPVARAEERPSPRVATLPVPAQSPRTAEVAALDPRRAAIAPQDSGSRASVDTSHRPESRLADLELPESRWESLPVGLEPNLEARDAEELPETPFVPTSRPFRVASSRQRLPEPGPLAERTQETAASSEAAEGPESAEPLATTIEIRPATLRSPVDSVEARPNVASEDRAPAPVSAALARLERRPSPGADVPLPSPRELDRSSPRPTLPEGQAERTGDLLAAETGPSGEERLVARAERRESRSRLVDAERPSLESLRPTVRRPAPAPASGATSGVSPAAAASTAAAPPAGAPLERSGPELEPPPAPIPEARRPSDARPSARRVELPEASPLEKKDLRVVRSGTSRQELLERGGGTPESEDAVRRALEWLARHQSPDGRWDVDGCESPGQQVRCDSAITGLVVLAFLGQNHTPGSEARFAPNVERALDWLVSQQTRDGNLAGPDGRYTMYSHGIATLALSETYLMTRDTRWLDPLRRAVQLIVGAQNPQTGGWRYQPTPPLRGDTSITGWQVMALKSAAAGGLEVPEAVFDRARHWLDVEVGGGTHGGIYGYTNRFEPRVAMVAEGLFTRQVLGGARGQPPIEEAARYLNTETRGGKNLGNLYLLYYGTLALYQYQGWIWEAWNEQVRDYLIRQQRRSGPLAGSWDPTDVHTEAGGRFLSTAFAVLTLEVYYRYLPLYWAPSGSDPR